MTDPATLTVPATLPIVRALLDQASQKNRRPGVLGIRARPEWSGPSTFLHDEVPVTLVPCVSSLAVREAVRQRSKDQWLVVLTDRSDGDLGAGVLSHLIHNRLRTPDPWEAVRHRFAATGIEPALTTGPANRDLAAGLLAAAPSSGWPPAPGGVLTLDHALKAVGVAHLGLQDQVVDATAVLSWTALPEAAARLADLRQLAGDHLVDTFLDWAARRAGAASAPLLHLLRSGESAQALPLGIVVGLLGDARDSANADAVQRARDCLIRLEPGLGNAHAPHVLRALAGESAAVVTWLLSDPATRDTAERLLARADHLADEVQAGGLTERSELLPSGLTRRLAGLADRLTQAVGPSTSAVTAEMLAAVEQEWSHCTTHRLAPGDRRVRTFLAAVRLSRWLHRDDERCEDFAALVDRQNHTDAWVDSAVNDTARGVDDTSLGRALEVVLAAVRVRRDTHDVEFAAGLADHTDNGPPLAGGQHAGVRHLEDLLPTVVLPLAKVTPVLLLVLDGMSVAVGHEVLTDALRRGAEGWAEALLPGASRRSSAIAVLPTLTSVSRTSLLCGALIAGQQDTEQRGHTKLTALHGLTGSVLFHKKPIDTTRPGASVADDVAAALDDIDGKRLVTCVLNTIDDALDRSDPGGTDWGLDAVRHLEPLLARARRAGRTVILTADHGHIVERREGTQKSHPDMTSGRSRGTTSSAGEGEVLVAGPRVLTADHRSVLAVDERLRYGPLKAGYHGGAAPAEVVVPVTVLVQGSVPPRSGLTLAAPQEPAWWLGPLTAPAPQLPPLVAQLTRRAAEEPPTLFDQVEPEPVIAPTTAGAEQVLASPVYRQQRARAGRVAVTDAQVGNLLTALLLSPSTRLAPAPAASALQVPLPSLRGAVPQVQRLLNVEGYPVLRLDVDGVTLVLDADLLREQFEVSP